MERLIISAPFGNYLHFAGTTPTVGTFTLHRRAGPLGRWWRVLRTVRHWRRAGAWVNRLGLPSPGIDAIRGRDLAGKIVSIHGFDASEWNALADALRGNPTVGAVEFNLSCPNVGHAPAFGEVASAIRVALKEGWTVIAKLPPVRWNDWANPLYWDGVRHFHCCNTIPTPGGGLSGKPLKPFALWAVADLRARHAGITLIGGGGVTCPADVTEYRRAGADHVAVASALFNPFAWRRVPALAKAANEPPPRRG